MTHINHPLAHTFVRQKDLVLGTILHKAYIVHGKGWIDSFIVTAYPSKLINMQSWPISNPAEWMDVARVSNYPREISAWTSISDAGIIDNSYNLHRTFFTHAEAQAYINSFW